MKKRRRISARTLRKLEGSVFAAPWIAGFLLFLAFPLGFSLYMSFHQLKFMITGPQFTYIGVKYYQEILFNNSALYNNLLPFMVQIALMVPIIIVFSLLIAVLLNQKFRGRFFFRTVFFLPVIFSTGHVVAEFANQGQGALGLLDRHALGAVVAQYGGVNIWTTALIEVLGRFVLVLWYSGVQIVIFLAGRQTIPASVYEASRIDGASPWQVFWKITLPAMTPFIFLNLIYTIVDMFTFPLNPVISLIGTGSYGYSSSLAWIYFVIIIAFLGAAMLLFRRATRNVAGAL